MSQWPDLTLPSLPVLHPWSPEALGQALAAMAVPLSSATSQAWPTANRAVLVPFTLQRELRPATWFWANGTVVSGNVEVGVWDRARQKVASSGSVAQAGTSAIQTAAVAGSPVLNAGELYYLVMCADNTTATFVRAAPTAVGLALLGGLVLATSLALPSDMSAASPTTSTNVPLGGFSTRSFL